MSLLSYSVSDSVGLLQFESSELGTQAFALTVFTVVVCQNEGKYTWSPSIKFDHWSTSWLSCLYDCCSVACGCRDRCGRNHLCRKSGICV